MNHESNVIVWKGIIGVVSAFGSVFVANVATIREWMQVLTLFLGCVVSIITIWQLSRNKKPKD